jgi:hypothetical protein
MTRGGDETVPAGMVMRCKVDGEVSSLEGLGWLGKRSSTERPPGVRRNDIYQSKVGCGDPGLPIQNIRYAYNSRSHDQCVMNPHIRVDNRITSSITVQNNILTIGHMTKHDIATQGKSTTKQRIPSSVDDPRHADYPTGN